MAVIVSDDRKYAAVSVKFASNNYKASILIYDIESHKSYPKRPKVIEYEDNDACTADFFFAGGCFSSDSILFACFSNLPHVGVLVYDWLRDKLLYKIPTKVYLTKISFHPKNNTKMCTSGVSNFFQFWHYTLKTTHAAPIERLLNGDHIYTCHAWLGPDKILGGTNTGYLTLIQGCELKHSVRAFDKDTHSMLPSSPVCGILIKGEQVIAYSNNARISLFELTMQEGKSGQGPSARLSLVAILELHGAERIYGLNWCLRSTSSLQLIVASPISLKVYDPSNDSRVKYDSSSLDFGSSSHGASTTDGSDQRRRNEFGGVSRGPSFAELPYLEKDGIGTLMPDRTILSYHSGAIHSLALSARISSFISCSSFDGSLNVWDSSVATGRSMVLEKYSSRTEVPSSVDLHPSGRYLSIGCEEFAAEYAVTDSKIELLRRIPTKDAITSPSGEPFVNTQAVSIVKYSHGGHLLAGNISKYSLEPCLTDLYG